MAADGRERGILHVLMKTIFALTESWELNYESRRCLSHGVSHDVCLSMPVSDGHLDIRAAYRASGGSRLSRCCRLCQSRTMSPSWGGTSYPLDPRAYPGQAGKYEGHELCDIMLHENSLPSHEPESEDGCKLNLLLTKGTAP